MPTISLEQLENHIQELQLLQMLLPQCTCSATLASVMSLIQTLCQEFGPASTLEDAIQVLVGRHLQTQMQTRKRTP